MAWFREDDKLHDHPKARKAGLTAMGLWAMSGTYSADYGLDGRVPVEYVATWSGGKRLASQLVDVKLWHPLPYEGPCECILPSVDRSGGGWVFHDWNDCNPSVAELEANRRSGAARQTVARNGELRTVIRTRDQDRCRYCGLTVKWNDRRGSLGGTYDHVIPDGPSDADNLVVCCRGCNSRKGRRTPEQAGMRLLPEPGQLF